MTHNADDPFRRSIAAYAITRPRRLQARQEYHLLVQGAAIFRSTLARR